MSILARRREESILVLAGKESERERERHRSKIRTIEIMAVMTRAPVGSLGSSFHSPQAA